jgi:ribonuclease D
MIGDFNTLAKYLYLFINLIIIYKMTNNTKDYQSINQILNQNTDFCKDLSEKVKKISTFINKIPILEDQAYYTARSEEYKNLLKNTKTKIAYIINKTFKYTHANDIEVSKYIYLNSSFDKISEQVDDYLFKVSDNIDIKKGIKKDNRDEEVTAELINIKTKSKPVIKFESKVNPIMKVEPADDLDIDNSYYSFIPKIKNKHHALTELNTCIEAAREERRLNLENYRNIKFEERNAIKEISFNHPYQDEIIDFLQNFKERSDYYNKLFGRLKYENKFTMDQIDTKRVKMSELLKISDKTCDYSDMIISARDVLNNINIFHNFIFNDKEVDNEVEFITTHLEIEYLPLNQTRFFYIEDQHSLYKMIDEINSHAQEIAVDLEHHSIESYLGITCLMQISTRFTDYIIDTLKLRQHLQELNIIFCNPRIVKVLHGADFDIEWLQKDFGIYIVNMFDTGQAARMLNLTSFSLANLLASVCSINADKKYQQADWRQRPLSSEMIKYAREDTHYLLFIYDHLKYKLTTRSLEKSLQPMYLYSQTVQKSTEICGKIYIKPVVKSQEYYQLKARNCTSLTATQMSVMKLLYKYRDFIARKQDVSTHHVMNNRILFQIVKLPNYDLNSVYLTLNPHSLFKNFANDFVNLVTSKLSKVKEKRDKTVSKMLESNYLEKMRERLNDSKKIISTISTSKISFNIENIQIKAIKCKNNSKVFPGVTCNIAEKFQKDYSEVTERLKSFDLIDYLKEKYNQPIKISNVKTAQVENNLKNNTLVKEKKNDEEKYLNQKRQRVDYIDLTESKQTKTRKTSESEGSDEDIPISRKHNTNINKFLDKMAEFQKNIKK